MHEGVLSVNGLLRKIWRKVRKCFMDPVLRKWLVQKCLFNHSKLPCFSPHNPEYLQYLLPLRKETPQSDLRENVTSVPDQPITLLLAGRSVLVQSKRVDKLFSIRFKDVETELSLHRFAWLSYSGFEIDPSWLNIIWEEWCKRFGQVKNSLVWHPYTVAERAINLLRFAEKNGLPGKKTSTLNLLREHAKVISENLEYFGDHDTSNHLANNGRGLFIIGLFLGMPKCADLGGKILLQESKRIFLPSGILREGSSHYHALITNNYATAWLYAKKYNRPESKALKKILENCCSVLDYLKLPGGMPLIGDISPDLSPLAVFKDLKKIRHRPNSPDPQLLIKDGWLKFEKFSWGGLWHASPDGWSHMPGHGHQDIGSFELHYHDIPVFIDPGRGHYGENEEAVLYVSGKCHNGLMVDGLDPYPPNKPYYDDSFRARVCGNKPQLKMLNDEVKIVHDGFSRRALLGRHERVCRFSHEKFAIFDKLAGSKSHTVTRTLCTPLPFQQRGDNLIFRLKNKKFCLYTNNGKFKIEASRHWNSYGYHKPAKLITLTLSCKLPWEGAIFFERIS